MIAKTLILPIAAVMAVAVASPSLAQNRWMDQAKEAQERRAENKAVREAEHPAPAPATTTASAATTGTATASASTTPAPAETTPAAQSAAPAH